MRKEAFYTIPADGGRDAGKIFKITELPTYQAEEWFYRVGLAITSSGIEVPPGVLESGMAGFALLGIKSLSSLPWEKAKPLLDDMKPCFQIQPSAKNTKIVRALVDDDVEEWTTWAKLRWEWFKLHVGFFGDAALSTSDLPKSEGGGSRATRMSRG